MRPQRRNHEFPSPLRQGLRFVAIDERFRESLIMICATGEETSDAHLLRLRNIREIPSSFRIVAFAPHDRRR